MKVERGGAYKPRDVVGSDARRRMNLRIREHIVAGTNGLPGIKPDTIYQARSGRALPADRYVRHLELLQDIGAPESATDAQLDAIRDHLRARRLRKLNAQKVAA